MSQQMMSCNLTEGRMVGKPMAEKGYNYQMLEDLYKNNGYS